jgi:hypothetical protein
MKLEKILDKLGSLENYFAKDYRYYYSKKSSTIKELENNLITPISWSSYSNKPKYKKNPS